MLDSGAAEAYAQANGTSVAQLRAAAEALPEVAAIKNQKARGEAVDAILAEEIASNSGTFAKNQPVQQAIDIYNGVKHTSGEDFRAQLRQTLGDNAIGLVKEEIAPMEKTGYNGSEPAGDEQILNGLQTALDIAGLIPGIGEAADGVNALISLARGNYADAALSGLAMIPFAGWAATAGKGVKYASKALNAASDAAKYADEVVDVGKRVFRETGDELAEEILRHGDDVLDAAKGAGDALNKLPKSTAESVTTKLTPTYLNRLIL